MSRVADFRDRALVLETAGDIDVLFADLDLGNIETVVLSGNTLGVPAAEAFGKIVRKMKNLKVARLASTFTTRGIDEIPQALTFICDALLECKSLTEIDLSHNALGVRSVQPVVPLLSKCLSLQTIKLSNNGISAEGGTIIARALLASAHASALLNSPSNLRTLLMNRNRLEDGSAPSWGAVILAHPGLQRFEMTNAGIREDGIVAIASALAGCPDLRRLRLRDNCIATYDYDVAPREGVPRGWKVVADVIRGGRLLRYLDLSACVLRTEGCAEIIAALGERVNERLDTLRLDINEFAEEHYEALADVVENQLPALRVLNLAVNDDLEDNEVVAAIGETLKKRGGCLIIEEEDESDGEGVDEEDDGDVAEENDVDQLAQLLESDLKVTEHE